MARKFTDGFLNHASELIAGGKTVPQVAALLCCDRSNLAKALTAKGLWKYNPIGRKPHNRRDDLPEQEIIDRYAAGESVLSLARIYKTERIVIDRIFRERGVQARDRSTAMYVRMGNLTPEERARLAEAAHAAVRGKFVPISYRIMRARRVQQGGFITYGPGEAELFKGLTDAGESPIQQMAIGHYNVDLVFGSVAVEVKFGAVGRLRGLRSIERTEEIIKAGYKLAVVFMGDSHSLGALNQIVALLQCVDREPASLREYWMVRSGLQKSPLTRRNGHNRPTVEAAPELVTSIRKIDF